MKKASFGQMIDQGKSKEEIMKLRGMMEADYEKALASLKKIREDAEKGELPVQKKKLYRHTGASHKWEK